MPGAYLLNNRITSAGMITPSSEDADYPAENLIDLQAAKVFRAAAAGAITILIDFGSAVAADTVAIINHNLAAGATITLKADNSSPPTTTRVSPAYRQHDIWGAFTDPSVRYYLLTLSGAGSSPVQIGQLLIGNRVALPRARRIASGYRPAQGRSNITGETYAGLLWSYHLYSRKMLNPSFRVASQAELDILAGLDAAAYGNHYPFVYIPETAAVNCYYVRKELGFEPEEIERIAGGNLAHDYQMTLVEESRGLEILA